VSNQADYRIEYLKYIKINYTIESEIQFPLNFISGSISSDQIPIPESAISLLLNKNWLSVRSDRDHWLPSQLLSHPINFLCQFSFIYKIRYNTKNRIKKQPIPIHVGIHLGFDYRPSNQNRPLHAGSWNQPLWPRPFNHKFSPGSESPTADVCNQIQPRVQGPISVAEAVRRSSTSSRIARTRSYPAR